MAARTSSTDQPEAPQQVEASTPETQPATDDGKPKTITTTVWAAEGNVPKASILQTAVQSVRDAIPVVFSLDSEITGARKSQRDKKPGTEFEVTITYTPRAVAGKEDPVDLDKVVRGLDVPRSFDGIGGHDGDPDFLEKTS